MNDDQTLSPLLDRVEALEAMVLRLEHRVGELSGNRPMSVGTTPTEDKEPKVPGERTPEELEELAQWVDRLQERYEEDTVGSSAALDWHEAAERCRERVRHAINTGPGCSYVNHRPDESITEDPRWIEEREALRAEAGLAPAATASYAATGKTESRETTDMRPGQTTIAPI